MHNSISVLIKRFEQVLNVFRVKVHVKIFDCFLELMVVKDSVSIRVKQLKLSSKPNEASATSLGKLFLESLNEDELRFRGGSTGSCLHVVLILLVEGIAVGGGVN